MKPHFAEAEVKQHLDLYYRQRADRLVNLKLHDLLENNSHLRNLIWVNSAIKIVDILIEDYLESYEKWWHELLTDNVFCLHVIRMRQLFWDSRYLYENVNDDAHNRLGKAMIEQFCDVDYRLDWEKLLLVTDRG